jgi:NTE family protein
MFSTPFTIGLSLSGGGYRAAAFHLGTLRKLKQMGVLDQVEVISTISGGSITGPLYCLEQSDFQVFDKKLYEGLQTKNVIKRILLSLTFGKLILFIVLFLGPAIYFFLTKYAFFFPILLASFIFLLLKFQFQIFPVSEVIEKAYDEFLFEKKTLGNLPEHPVLVIGSSNLQTSRPFTFSKNWMQDSTYQYMDDPVTFKATAFPISKAVMASSCVPFAFTPVSIDKIYFSCEDDFQRVHPVLVDGGVYDNQGIHKIVQKGRYECSTIITSDAGAGANTEMTFHNTISLLITTVDVFMARIKKSQMIRDLYDNVALSNKKIAYFSLGWDTEKCIPGFIKNIARKQITQSVVDAHHLEAAWIADPLTFEAEITNHLKEKIGYNNIVIPSPDERKIARSVGTNLTSLSKQKIDCLIKQAASLTEIQIKLYCPHLIP